MLRAMHTAASGMRAQQINLDTIAHNLANVNTTGFKRAHAGFEDVLYQTLVPPTAGEGNQPGRPVALQVGHGSRVVDTARNFSQGDTETTGNPLDLVIQGEGFFVVQRPDGTEGYTRDGSLRVDSDRRLVTSGGMVLQPEIALPADTTSIAVTADGRVIVEQAGQASQTEVGQLLVARFPNPAGLLAEGGNVYRASAGSGDAQVGTAGDLGFGSILQGAIERSNVQVVEEMVNLIVAQRAFEMNSKAIRTAEDMMGTAVNIRPA